jgi:hypothetical protein
MNPVAQPKFAVYVRAVEGRLVGRWGSKHEYFGARRTAATLQERRAGKAMAVWDTQRVIPLTADYCRRFRKELRKALRNGDLLECKVGDYSAWLRIQAEREKKHTEKLAEQKKKAAEEKAKSSNKESEGGTPKSEGTGAQSAP